MKLSKLDFVDRNRYKRGVEMDVNNQFYIHLLHEPLNRSSKIRSANSTRVESLKSTNSSNVIELSSITILADLCGRKSILFGAIYPG